MNDVKLEFDDTFSKDVYEKLGIKRRENKFSELLLHSARGNLTTRSILTDLDSSTVDNELERKHLVEYHDTMYMNGYNPGTYTTVVTLYPVSKNDIEARQNNASNVVIAEKTRRATCNLLRVASYRRC